MSLPTEAKARKDIPIYSGFIKYFPDAMAAVAELSRKGNDQHHPGKPLHWDRSKSGDELDALTRHLSEAGTVDTDGVRHSAKVAWRAMANLQKEIERERIPTAGADGAVKVDDGWIPNQGAMPCSLGTRVDVMFRDGFVVRNNRADTWTWQRSDMLVSDIAYWKLA